MTRALFMAERIHLTNGRVHQHGDPARTVIPNGSGYAGIAGRARAAKHPTRLDNHGRAELKPQVGPVAAGRSIT
jgi:hypothetical protein